MALWQGAGLRLLAVFLMTAMSSLIHAVGQNIELGQIIFWRSIVAMLPITVYMMLRHEFPRALRTQRPRLHVTRGLLAVVAMTLSFISYINLPVANAQALGFLAPILTLPLASIILKEKLTPAVIAGVVLGFGGVILMLLQAFERPTNTAALGIAAGLGYAGIMAFIRIYVKSMTQQERVSTIAFYFTVAGTLAGLATALFGWTQPTVAQLAMLVSAGLLGGLGHIAATEAVSRAPVSVVAPFDFTGLIWAAGFDLLLFNHTPGWLVIIGMAVITLAALIVTVKGERVPQVSRRDVQG